MADGLMEEFEFVSFLVDGLVTFARLGRFAHFFSKTLVEAALVDTSALAVFVADLRVPESRAGGSDWRTFASLDERGAPIVVVAACVLAVPLAEVLATTILTKSSTTSSSKPWIDQLSTSSTNSAGVATSTDHPRQDAGSVHTSGSERTASTMTSTRAAETTGSTKAVTSSSVVTPADTAERAADTPAPAEEPGFARVVIYGRGDGPR